MSSGTPKVTYYRRDGRFGWYNDFARAGDRIPPHWHAPEMQHDVEVLRGAVEVLGQVLEAGDRLRIDSDRVHAVLALEDGTRTLHLLLVGDAGFDYPDGHVAEE